MLISDLVVRHTWSRNLKLTLANNWRGYLDAASHGGGGDQPEQEAGTISSEVGQVDRQAGSLVGASMDPCLTLYPPLPSC